MREVAGLVGRRDWDGLQSRWVLPTARRLYLIGALIAVLVAVLAVAVAVACQIGMLGSSSSEPVPDVAIPQVRTFSVDSLNSLFAGPQRLRAEPTAVAGPVTAGTEIARLRADTVFGISEFQLIGGANADDVTQGFGAVASSIGGGDALVQGMVLRASDQLVKRVGERGAGGAPLLVVRVVAQDRNGNRSAPADVSFRLRFAAPQAPAGPAASGDVQEDIAGPTAILQTAEALASLAGARGTPEWIDAFKSARDEPKRCGADGDERFLRQYNAAYRTVRARLTASNVGTFYTGLCDAWNSAFASARTEAADANAKRDQAMMRNAAREGATMIRKAAARGMRDVALGVAATAVFFFMVVALFLAFLAIEGHSHAVRQALQLIAQRDGDRRVG